MKIKLIMSAIIAVIIFGNANADDAIFNLDSGSLKRLSAMAKKPAFQLPNDPKAVEFVFDRTMDMKAEINENGRIKAEGWVKHNRLRCATYQLGIRFGKGDNACANVEWLTDVKYLTEQKQCNQVKLHHKGYEADANVKANFDKITCGQLLIKCTGVCK